MIRQEVTGNPGYPAISGNLNNISQGRRPFEKFNLIARTKINLSTILSKF